MKLKLNLQPSNKAHLQKFEETFLNNRHLIEDWLRNKWHKNPIPFYGSVDLRNNGFKIAPVDMNLYPGGFNNVSPDSVNMAPQAATHCLEKYCATPQKILLIPENHTRNHHYIKNVYTIYNILEQAGYETMIGTLSPEITEPTVMKISPSKSLTYYPIVRDGTRIKTINGFDPCLIILNNDLSGGKPEILENLEQTVLPPLNAGWYMRKKTHFFEEYNHVCEEFAKIINIDPWLINPYFDVCNELNFAHKSGLELLANKVDQLIAKIRIKYAEYGIKETPYVVVKANNGTYGMGIMIVKSGDEILSINSRSRSKMAVIKDRQTVNDVIIQEGVHTIEEIDKQTAEAVMYMMGGFTIGGFYRVHPEKDFDDNLNSVGADFIPMPFTNVCMPDKKAKSVCPPTQFYTYSVIARLSLLASSMEIQKYR